MKLNLPKYGRGQLSQDLRVPLALTELVVPAVPPVKLAVPAALVALISVIPLVVLAVQASVRLPLRSSELARLKFLQPPKRNCYLLFWAFDQV